MSKFDNLRLHSTAIRKSDNRVVIWYESEHGLLPALTADHSEPQPLDRTVQWNDRDFHALLIVPVLSTDPAEDTAEIATSAILEQSTDDPFEYAFADGDYETLRRLYEAERSGREQLQADIVRLAATNRVLSDDLAALRAYIDFQRKGQ